MGALKDLWESERGLVAALLIIATTVLCGMGMITADQWLEYTRWLFLTYAAAKTVTGAACIIKGAPLSASTAPTPTASPAIKDA